MGSEFLINTYTADEQSKSAITALSGGDFIVVWHSNIQDGDGNGVYGQRFDSSNTKLGAEFLINSHTTDNQQFPSITELSDGDFLVTWESNLQDGNSWGTYGQRFNLLGDPVGDEFQLNQYTPGDQSEAAVTALPGGGFLVSWHSEAQDGDGYSVQAQRFDVKGNPVLSSDEPLRYLLSLDAKLIDGDDADTLSVTLSDLPSGVTLSAGTDQGDGSWALTQNDLSGLSLTIPTSITTNFDLTVTATRTESTTSETVSTTDSLSIIVTHAPTLSATLGSASADTTNNVLLYPVTISAALQSGDSGETLTVTLGGLPQIMVMAAGHSRMQKRHKQG